MKYSFVLVNYADSWALISTCLRSITNAALASDVEYEAIVVNNDPPYETGTFCGATVVESGRNIGFARAVNQGIRRTSGDAVVLLNPDSTLGDGFFETITNQLEDEPEVGVAGPRIFDADGAVQLSARRDFSFTSGLFGRTSLLTRLFPKSRFVKGHFPVTDTDVARNVDWVSGACMVVRHEVFEHVGLLDERFFMYFEDADLCRRARTGGYGIRYLPEATVAHDAGGSTKSRPLAIFRLHRSAFLYHRKYGPHGPLGLFSAFVLAGLVARALAGIISHESRRRAKP